jgi:hypothetical protein
MNGKGSGTEAERKSKKIKVRCLCLVRERQQTYLLATPTNGGRNQKISIGGGTILTKIYSTKKEK